MRILKILSLSLGIGIGIYLLFVTFIVFSPEIQDYFNRTEFDSEKWKSWEESVEEPSVRWNMIADLENDHELVGMTTRQVADLLGDPEQKGNLEWRYYLGMSGHGIDTGL